MRKGSWIFAICLLLLAQSGVAQSWWDTYSDTWVATDGLGRKLPTYKDVGGPKSDKTLMMFYYIPTEFHGDNQDFWGPWDNTKLIAANPTNPQYGPAGAPHFWGESVFGYYHHQDRYVITKHIQMLNDAQIDVWYLDISNGIFPSYEASIFNICGIIKEMKAAGRKVPKLAFMVNSNAATTLARIHELFYATGAFSDLWFQLDGKPLALAPSSEMPSNLLGYFTFRRSWAWSAGQDNWTWLENYPQRFAWHTSPSVPEQISVASASHPTIFKGKSFYNGTQTPINSQRVTDLTLQDPFFAEQWQRALEVNPPIVCVTQWNEWIASRFLKEAGKGDESFLGKPLNIGDSYFVDAYNSEFNRDLEPSKGINQDHHYYQLIANARRYKGVRPIPQGTVAKTITPSAGMAQWDNVGPEYRDDIREILVRNTYGSTPKVQYTDYTGRNDIRIAKVARDASNLYFMTQTEQAMSLSSDANWMVLYVDADTNTATGWLGYDYRINQTRSTSGLASLEKNSGGWGWTKVGDVALLQEGNTLQITVPRSLLGKEASKGRLFMDFKWTDNLPVTPSALDLIDKGDMAPNGRFNYRYLESALALALLPYGGSASAVPGTIQVENFDQGGSMLAYSDLDSINNGGQYRLSEAPDLRVGADIDGAYALGWTQAGEWLKYSVQVASTGIYRATFRVATPHAGQRLQLQCQGKNLTGSVTIPSTGAFTTWNNVIVEGLSLDAGSQVLTLLFETGNVDINYFKLEKTSSATPPQVKLFASSVVFGPYDTITVTAAASSLASTISKVEFYLGTQKLGEATGLPYQVKVSGLSMGVHTIWAKAYDALGGIGNALPIAVRVQEDLARTRWDFTRDLEGWTLNSSLSGSVSQGQLQLTVVGGDPYFYQGTYFSASNKKLRILMKNGTADTQGQLFWNSQVNGVNNFKTLWFNISPNDLVLREYIIDMSSNPDWAGNITSLRFDIPNNGANRGNIAVDLIEAFSVKPQSLTFDLGANKTKTSGDNAFFLEATASSGLSVGYTSSNPTVASITGGKVSVLKAGTATITASQAGNSTYSPATSVTQLLTVTATSSSSSAISSSVISSSSSVVVSSSSRPSSSSVAVSSSSQPSSSSVGVSSSSIGIGLCATAELVTSGGSRSVAAQGYCFKIDARNFKWGTLFSVRHTISNAQTRTLWYGGTDQNVTTCGHKAVEMNGNGAQYNNMVVGKDISGFSWIQVIPTNGVATAVYMEMQNWQNGVGCGIPAIKPAPPIPPYDLVEVITVEEATSLQTSQAFAGDAWSQYRGPVKVYDLMGNLTGVMVWNGKGPIAKKPMGKGVFLLRVPGSTLRPKKMFFE